MILACINQPMQNVIPIMDHWVKFYVLRLIMIGNGMKIDNLKLVKATYENEDGTLRYVEEGEQKKTWFKSGIVSHGYGYFRRNYQGWQKHREDGPAQILEDGTEKWYQNGVLHREDGPASYDKKGRPMYRLNGAKVPAMKVSQDKHALWHMIKHEKDGKTVDKD